MNTYDFAYLDLLSFVAVVAMVTASYLFLRYDGEGGATSAG